MVEPVCRLLGYFCAIRWGGLQGEPVCKVSPSADGSRAQQSDAANARVGDGCVWYVRLLLVVLSMSVWMGCGAHGSAAPRGDSVDRHTEVEPKTDFAVKVLEGRGIRYCGGGFEYEGEIFFEYNKDTLKRDREETDATIGKWVEYLKRYPKLRVKVVGHTDSRGASLMNANLSLRRARSVARELRNRGVPAGQLDEPEGMGEEGTEQIEGPDCYNKEPEGCEDKETPGDRCKCKAVWAKSRRVEFAPVEGTDALEEDCGQAAVGEAAKAEPDPESACPENLWGIHINAGRPNHFVGAALAWQPLCWLEVTGGVGFWPKKSVEGDGESGKYSAWSIPIRARFWPGRHHSFIADVGGGYIQVNVDVREPIRNESDSTSYGRNFGFLGIGYGYRSNGAFRLALLGGVMAMGKIGRFESISEPTVYPELSVGFLW
ncbi:MAG TPA: OmpA family protein [Polyangiaceae bacterium]|nr:MAG: Outer membrane lipoprotein Omp16 precursor [Deltaproteobacteria bacterium ADurb.Bin207]HNZ25588.1 OmpA family protein [Polyangiaceae bacterium]HOD25743.1 OmpA family protein [Polyangiaceae bacterium]HOH03833.1 OmpA family protein [Polyangiaceae bacterium]HOR38320.1 OmpA family protein [Polyangiaceae bacterium]